MAIEPGLGLRFPKWRGLLGCPGRKKKAREEFLRERKSRKEREQALLDKVSIF